MRGDSPVRALAVALMAALFGWIIGLVFPLIRPEFAAIVAGIAGIAGEVVHRLADRGLASPNLRLAELGAGFLIAKVVHLALLGPALRDELAAFPAGLADPETILGFLLMWFVRGAAYKTVRDVRLLGSPGDETVGTAFDRLARRFRSLLGFSVILSAFAVAGWQQLAILDRPALGGLVLPLALMTIMGVGFLGAFRRIEDEGRWRRAGALVEPAVWVRWGSGVIAITGLVAAAVLFFRVGADEYARAPAAVIRGFAAAGSALLRVLGVGDANVGDQTNVPTFEATPTDTTSDGIFDFLLEETSQSEASAWEVAVITLAWALATFGLIALVVAVLRNRRWIRSAFQIGPAEGFKAIFSEFFRMLAELGRLIWSMLTFWRRPLDEDRLDDEAGDGDLQLMGRSERWAPTDEHRSRIAAAYQRFVRSATRLLPRHRAETPDEYARAIGRRIPFGRSEAGLLTDLYVEARYSTHAIADDDIGRAEALSEQLDHIVDQQVEGESRRS